MGHDDGRVGKEGGKVVLEVDVGAGAVLVDWMLAVPKGCSEPGPGALRSTARVGIVHTMINQSLIRAHRFLRRMGRSGRVMRLVRWRGVTLPWQPRDLVYDAEGCAEAREAQDRQ